MFEPPFMSVCIPTYEMGGYGCQFLRHSLESLSEQEFRDYEIIVTDQSEGHAIKNLCKAFSTLNVRHIPTAHLKRQASANTNAAIESSTGTVIKILFQDDFVHGTDALSRIAAAFENPETRWCVSGSRSSYDGIKLIKPFVPHYHERIHFGKNTISSPSVLAFQREHSPRFDENLVWLMDVDFYKTCAASWGAPLIIPEPLVVNRLHSGQVSASVNPELIRRELRYIRDKYQEDETWGDWLHYLGRLRRTYL